MHEPKNDAPFTTSAALAFFALDRALIDRVILTGLSRGADACELFFQSRKGFSLNLSDHAVRQGGARVLRGVGIRALKDGRSGYSHTADLSEAGMKEAARVAAMIADGFPGTRTEGDTPRKPMDPGLAAVESLYGQADFELDVDRARAWLEGIDRRCHELDPRVVRAIVAIEAAGERLLIVDSDGRVSCDERPLFSAYVGCVAESGTRVEENWESSGARVSPRRFMSDDAAESLASRAVKGTVGLFDAVEAPSGEMPLVLAAGGGGILLHEAMGHGFEADFIRKGTSIFAGRLGETVARDDVTIVDSGLLTESYGSLKIDDEGNPTRETVLVDRGRLSSWIHDAVSARHFGVDPTGNGRREDYRHAPLPRMRNTFMRPGPCAKDEIVSSVRRGIYAERFSNGEVDIGPGDFSFYVKSGYLIENGKLAAPVKDVNLIGNGPNALSAIEMVGNDLVFDRGCNHCGKDGQIVPVSMGTPTLKIRSITVGGRA